MTVLEEIYDQFYRVCTKDKFLYWLAENRKAFIARERKQIEDANKADKQDDYYEKKFKK